MRDPSCAQIETPIKLAELLDGKKNRLGVWGKDSLVNVIFCLSEDTHTFKYGVLDSIPANQTFYNKGDKMAKTVVNVMRAVSKSKQIAGMTIEEIRQEFAKAGYGTTKVAKRTRELMVSAAIQSDGTKRDGKLVFWCIYWPYGASKCDMSRFGTVTYVDPRHTELIRADGRENAWLLIEE